MARPRIEGMFYFPHDCDAHSEPGKMEPLMLLYGLAGYGHYFVLLEMAYLTPDGCLDISQPEKRKLIARKMFCTEKQFEKILADEIRFGLFDKALYEEKGMLTSNGIRRRRETVLHERTRKRQGYSRNNSGETTEGSGQNDGERGGKGKEKEKEKGESKTNAPRRIDKIAFGEAEKAWTVFEELLRSPMEDRFVVSDPLSQKIAIALGGRDRLVELHAQGDDRLHQEFITRYAILEKAEFKAKAV